LIIIQVLLNPLRNDLDIRGDIRELISSLMILMARDHLLPILFPHHLIILMFG